MQIGEAVALAVIKVQEGKDPSCEHEDKDPSWKSRVNKFNSQEGCTGTRLYKNMDKNRSAHQKAGLGVVPTKTSGKVFGLADIDANNFPIQAHHLIPKNFLPELPVAMWLAVKNTSNKKYGLLFDSKYDTDHHNNGYCLPYVSVIKEWKKAENFDDKFMLGCEVIDRAGLQLHEGSHPVKFDEKEINKRLKIPLLPIKDKAPGPDSDDDEQDEIETAGYLDKVELLLNAVHGKTLAHVDSCESCKAKKSGKKSLVPALSSVVDMVDDVSHILKILIDARVIYVSWYGYAHAFKNELISGQVEDFTLSKGMEEIFNSKIR